MFSSQVPVALLSLALAGLYGGVAAQDSQAVAIDFYTDVLYSPPEAWHTAIDSSCGTVDHYTSQINASATISFVGEHIQVYGAQNNASGVLGVVADNQPMVELNLWSEDVECNLFADWYFGNGSHTLTLTLLGLDPVLNETLAGNVDTAAVLRLTDIVYWVPEPAASDPTATSSSVAGDLAVSSNHTNVAAIVAGTVCGVVGLVALVVCGILLYRKRRTHNQRHKFDPTAVYITELSPRTATTPDTAAKFGDYARFDDDVETRSVDAKSGGLVVPELHFNPSGLRSRSRSPAPDRKPAP